MKDITIKREIFLTESIDIDKLKVQVWNDMAKEFGVTALPNLDHKAKLSPGLPSSTMYSTLDNNSIILELSGSIITKPQIDEIIKFIKMVEASDRMDVFGESARKLLGELKVGEYKNDDDNPNA